MGKSCCGHLTADPRLMRCTQLELLVAVLSCATCIPFGPLLLALHWKDASYVLEPLYSSWEQNSHITVALVSHLSFCKIFLVFSNLPAQQFCFLYKCYCVCLTACVLSCMEVKEELPQRSLWCSPFCRAAKPSEDVFSTQGSAYPIFVTLGLFHM